VRRRGPGKAWRKADAGVDPTRLLAELERRTLSDLATCQRVWEDEADPLAVCEAVRQVDLPGWLLDAVLLLAADSEGLTRALWTERRTHAVDKARAASVAAARTGDEPSTWDQALPRADLATRRLFTDMPSVSPAALRKSYQRVGRDLDSRESRYYDAKPGLDEQIAAARKRFLVRAELGTEPPAK